MGDSMKNNNISCNAGVLLIMMSGYLERENGEYKGME